MKNRLFVTLLVLLATPPARAHDDGLSTSQAELLRKIVERLRKTPLSADEAWAIDLGSFSAHDLEHVPSVALDLGASVLARLTDEDPAVAAACAMDQPLYLCDHRIVDRMIASLSDTRRVTPQAFPLFRRGPETAVRECMRHVLSDWIEHEKEALRPRVQDPRALTPPNPIPPIMEEEALRAWWKQGRETFGYGTPAPLWRRVLHESVVLDIGKPLVLVVSGEPVTIVLRQYEESWSVTGAPVTTVDLTFDGGPKGRLNNPEHEDGFVHRYLGSSGRTWQWTAAFMPTRTPRRVRVQLTLHFCDGGGR